MPMISRTEYGRLRGAWQQARQQNLASGKKWTQPSFSVKPSFNVRPSWAPRSATRTMGSTRRKWMAGRGKEKPRGQFEFSGDVRPSADMRAGAGRGDPQRMFKSSWRGTPRPDYSGAALRKRFGLTGRDRPVKATRPGDVVGPESRRRRAFEMLGAGVGA